VILDREFFLHDIAASAAHAQGLQHIGILSADELAGAARTGGAGAGLPRRPLRAGHAVRRWSLAIEARLTERLGDAGRKIHTGRSRNDQILVATRLWLKEKLQRVAQLSTEVAKVALDRAQAEKDLLIPGYTHIQRAGVFGRHVVGRLGRGLHRQRHPRRDTHALVDANPLGTAAGYGVNLPLDREHTTAALASRACRSRRSTHSAASSSWPRWKRSVAPRWTCAASSDLSLFTSAEFGFVALPAQYTTGSSIMPNKRNLDVIELMRATHASVAAARTEIEQLLSLPSGYHRDLQSSKGAIFHGFGRGLAALELLPALLANLEWRDDRLRAAIDSGMYATDVAVEAAVAGVPFREAYKAAAAGADSAGQGRTPEGSLARVYRRARPPICAWTNCAHAGRRCPDGGTVYLVLAMRRPDFNDAACSRTAISSMRCRRRASCS
jgi:argininosuccinate lyase